MFTSYLFFRCYDIIWKLWNLLGNKVKGKYDFERSTLCFLNSSCSSLIYAGFFIMNHVVKVNKELSQVNIIRVSKLMMSTNITRNREKSLIRYQNRSSSTEDEFTNCYQYFKKKRGENNVNWLNNMCIKLRLQLDLELGFGSLVSCLRVNLFLLVLKRLLCR